MTSAVLTPCASCARHVRRNEDACPFCGVAIAPDVVAPRRLVSERLGRAAIFSLGAATITSLAGCGARSELTIAPMAERDAGQDGGTFFGAYGGPGPLRDDAGAPSTHYGGPPIMQDDAATADAGVDADLGCCSADYGGPPSP